MRTFRLILSTLLALTTVCAAQSSNDVKVSYGEITDTRTTAERSSVLQIKLKLIGEAVRGAQQVKTEVSRAVDDTGKDLLEPQVAFRVTHLYDPPAEQAEATIQLRNPVRRAVAVKELEGEIIAFVARNDSAATVSIDHFISQTGETLTNEALQSADIEIKVLTREQFDAINKQEMDARQSMSSGILGRPLPFHSRYPQVGDNGVVLKIADPKSKVVAIEFVDASGQTVRPRMTVGSEELRIFDFSQKPSIEMGLKVLLSTPKSMIHIPFNFTDIPLP